MFYDAGDNNDDGEEEDMGVLEPINKLYSMFFPFPHVHIIMLMMIMVVVVEVVVMIMMAMLGPHNAMMG